MYAINRSKKLQATNNIESRPSEWLRKRLGRRRTRPEKELDLELGKSEDSGVMVTPEANVIKLRLSPKKLWKTNEDISCEESEHTPSLTNQAPPSTWGVEGRQQRGKGSLPVLSEPQVPAQTHYKGIVWVCAFLC